MPRDPHEQPASREGAVSLTITEKMLMQKRSGRVGVSFAQAETLYSQMILQGIKEVAANLNLDLLPVQDARLNSEVEKISWYGCCRTEQMLSSVFPTITLI